MDRLDAANLGGSKDRWTLRDTSGSLLAVEPRRGYARASLSETLPDPASGSEDAAAVSRVAAGDLEALSDLYGQYGRMVYSVAYRVLGDSGAAEECVQDVFTELWRHAAS